MQKPHTMVNNLLFLIKQSFAFDNPQAEYEVYKNLYHVSENRTAISISHRMSSCNFCDRILVFDEGRLVQEGSHEKLLGFQFVYPIHSSTTPTKTAKRAPPLSFIKA